MSIRFARIILTTATIAALLGACSSTAEHRETNCPSAAVLASLSSLTMFKPNVAQEPANELFTIGLSDVQTDCDFSKTDGTTDSSLNLKFHAKRPAPGDAATYEVPYFVVVSENGKIVDKKAVSLNFSFPAGAAEADASESVPSTHIDLENGKRPYDYQLLVGFQLTQEQLDYNKKMSRFAP